VSTDLLIGTRDGVRHLDTGAVELSGHHITALATPWAITDGQSLWRLDADSPPVEVARFDGRPAATCLLPLDSAVLVGTAEGHLVRVEQATATTVEGFDRAEGRSAWHTPWGGPADVRSMASGGEAIYVNVHVGGILTSLDDGLTWTPAGLDIDTDVHQVLAVDHLVLAALGHGGLARSKDGGQSWTITSHGLHSSYCRALAASDDTVLISASTGPRTQQGALYRGSVAGDTLEQCHKGLPEWFSSNIDTRCLVLEGTNAAFGTDDGRVFVSTDTGGSWAQAAAGLPPITGLQFAPA
jgi:outer membrane protein assembly factor BamB